MNSVFTVVRHSASSIRVHIYGMQPQLSRYWLLQQQYGYIAVPVNSNFKQHSSAIRVRLCLITVYHTGDKKITHTPSPGKNFRNEFLRKKRGGTRSEHGGVGNISSRSFFLHRQHSLGVFAPSLRCRTNQGRNSSYEQRGCAIFIFACYMIMPLLGGNLRSVKTFNNEDQNILVFPSRRVGTCVTGFSSCTSLGHEHCPFPSLVVHSLGIGVYGMHSNLTEFRFDGNKNVHWCSGGANVVR